MYAINDKSIRIGTQIYATYLKGSESAYRRLSELSGTSPSDISLIDDLTRKKKAEAEAIAEGVIVDPLADLDIDIQSFDIPRMVSVYPDRAGIRWWTKCWFNNKEDGEPAIEIDQKLAILFLHDQIDKDEWLEEYYPKQMEMYHNAIEQTKEQLLSQSI